MIRTIPEDFLIGTSSSAWQIEGVAGKSKEQKSWAELFYASDAKAMRFIQSLSQT